MSFQLGHLRSQSMALVKELPVAADEQFQDGALLVETSGEYAEATADDYGVVGQIDAVALARYGIDGLVPYEGAPSFDILGGFGFPPGFMQGIVVDQGNREIMFSAQYVGTLPTEVGGLYGVVRGADLKWRVNFADTTNEIVRLESIAWAQTPLNKGRVVVSFAAAPEV